MTRDFEHLKFRAEKVAFRRGFDKEIRLRRFNVERKPEAAKKIRVGNHRRGIRVATDGAPKLSLNLRNVRHVIVVPVRQDQHFQIDTTANQPFATSVGRVKKDCAFRSMKEIAIRFKNSAAKRLVFHRGNVILSAVEQSRGFTLTVTRRDPSSLRSVRDDASGGSVDFEFSGISVVLFRYCRCEFKPGLLLSGRQNATMQNLFLRE